MTTDYQQNTKPKLNQFTKNSIKYGYFGANQIQNAARMDFHEIVYVCMLTKAHLHKLK